MAAKQAADTEYDARYVFCIVFPLDEVDEESGGSTGSGDARGAGAGAALQDGELKDDASARSADDRPDKVPRSEIQAAIRKAGLKTKTYLNAKKDKIICEIGAPMSRLLKEADRVNHALLLDPVALREADRKKNLRTKERIRRRMSPEVLASERGQRMLLARGDVIENREEDGGRYGPYQYIYAKYDSSPKLQRLYRKVPYTNSVLREVDIVTLVITILEAPVDAVPSGAGLTLHELCTKNKAILDFYPLHDKVLSSALEDRWCRWSVLPWQQPLDDIETYLGPKIALYFTWLGHYTWWLLWPSLIGLAVWLHQQTEGHVDVGELPIYGIIVALWASMYQEAWKRREKRQALKFGMSDFEARETSRPEFDVSEETEDMASPVSGEPTRGYKDPSRVARRVLVSALCITFLAIVVVAAVFSIFVLREWLVSLELDGELPEGYAGNIAAVANALQIQIFNLISQKVAYTLNDWELHRTDTQYEDALIAKTFLFQLVNSYFGLFYVAFIKKHLIVTDHSTGCKLNEEGEQDCMTELSGQLMVILLSRIFVGNLQELLVPRITACIKKKTSQGMFLRRKETRAEKEGSLPQFDIFANYAEMIITHGYCSLFVVAFPLAPLLAFINNLVEVHVDQVNALVGSKRMEPRGAQDIGTWYRILDVMGKVAVVTNLTLAVFVMPSGAFEVQDPVWQWVLFVCLEHAVFGLKMIVDVVVPDTPRDVALQLQRQEYLVDKHILGVGEDIVDVDDDEFDLDMLDMKFPVAETREEAEL